MSRILITAQNYWFWGGAVENIQGRTVMRGGDFWGALIWIMLLGK